MSDPMAERRAFLANVTEFEAAVRAQAIERPGQVWPRDSRPCDQRVDAARKRVIAQLDALSRVVAAADGWHDDRDQEHVRFGKGCPTCEALVAAVAALRATRVGNGGRP